MKTLYVCECVCVCVLCVGVDMEVDLDVNEPKSEMGQQIGATCASCVALKHLMATWQWQPSTDAQRHTLSQYIYVCIYGHKLIFIILYIYVYFFFCYFLFIVRFIWGGVYFHCMPKS